MRRPQAPGRIRSKRRKMPRKEDYRSLPAGIQYVGNSGDTEGCIDALARFISYGDVILSARLLTCGNEHAFLLFIEPADYILVKDGFASGYGGGGPHGLSYALQLLEAHGIDVEEVVLPRPLFERANDGKLSIRDLDRIGNLRPVRPRRIHNRYIWEDHFRQKKENALWADFRPVIPFAIIDPRLMDLAITFWEGPDQRLLTAFRRLEDIVRSRTGLVESGTKLFSEAFNSKPAKLTWPGLVGSELAARAQMFTGAFGTFRNPRGHKELNQDQGEQLAEFLVVNQLYRLERDAKAPETAKAT